jgi:hypothetical protein
MNDRAGELRKLTEDWATRLRGDAAFLEGALTDVVVGIMPLGFMLNVYTSSTPTHTINSEQTRRRLEANARFCRHF